MFASVRRSSAAMLKPGTTAPPPLGAPLLVEDLPPPMPRLAPRPIGIGLDVVGDYRAARQVNAREVAVEHRVGGERDSTGYGLARIV